VPAPQLDAPPAFLPLGGGAGFFAGAAVPVAVGAGVAVVPFESVADFVSVGAGVGDADAPDPDAALVSPGFAESAGFVESPAPFEAPHDDCPGSCFASPPQCPAPSAFLSPAGATSLAFTAGF
jgi:hypothetical protein